MYNASNLVFGHIPLFSLYDIGASSSAIAFPGHCEQNVDLAGTPRDFGLNSGKYDLALAGCLKSVRRQGLLVVLAF